ncbi:MAG: SDR family oxidoreductase [Thermoleophilia bacterium]|nr:SDR family oxidoreductase [Thermoleophilia bacterium]
MPVALVTGASRGLGRAVAHALTVRGYRVVADGRDPAALARAAASAPGPGTVTAVPGDQADPAHRRALGEAVRALGRLDAMVACAAALGVAPPPRLEDHPAADLERLFAVNAVAPVAMLARVLPQLEAAGGRVVLMTSDAAVAAYEGWGGYGASKAALELLTAVVAVEHPSLRVYALDPGEMDTAMLRAAMPGEDLSDRAAPDDVAPAVVRLLEGDLPGGRYIAAGMPAVPA